MVVPAKAGEGVIILQLRIQRVFIPAYNDPSSTEYKNLVRNITAELDRGYRERFPLTFLRCCVLRLWAGSVGVDTQLIFQNETVLPNVTVVAESLKSAINDYKVFLDIIPSSVTAGNILSTAMDTNAATTLTTLHTQTQTSRNITRSLASLEGSSLQQDLPPVCKETQWSLPVHLRRSCMKNSPGMDIERAVDASEKEANELLRRGRVWEYGLIRKILDNPNPVDSPTTVKTTPLRERMANLGLYGKHSIDHPLLRSFVKDLQVDLANENLKQEALETATEKMTDIEVHGGRLPHPQFSHCGECGDGYSSEEGGAKPGSGCSQLVDQGAYDLLVKSYPVTVDGAAPKWPVHVPLTGVRERCCSDRWHSDQLQLRHFGQRLLSEDRMRSWIEKQGFDCKHSECSCSQAVEAIWGDCHYFRSQSEFKGRAGEF
ncbi:hypothetical protein AOLI_G00233360 [Acnodon oligacanthus]